MIHELKCWISPFQSILVGDKKFEFRKNDRGFELGDTLYLREYSNDCNEYTGKEILVDIVYIIKEGFGIPKDYCIMSLSDTRTVLFR